MSEQTAGPPKAKAKKAAAKPGKKSAVKAGPKAAGAAPVETKTFKAESPPQPPPSRPTLGEAPRMPGFDTSAFSADQRGQIEQLSMNLARAALTAQGAIAEMALRQADRPAALSPDPFHVGPALTQVMGRLAAQPDRMMRAQGELF